MDENMDQNTDQNTEQHKPDRRQRLLRIAVPLLIIMAVAAIYFIRQAPKSGGVQGLDIAVLDMKALEEQALPILLVFGTADCPACRSFRPTLEKFYQDTQGRALVHYLDLSKYPELGQNFPIQAVPSMALYLAGGKPYMPGENSPGNFTLYSLRDTGEHALTLHTGTLTEAQLYQLLEEMEGA